MFQHTAARRRLAWSSRSCVFALAVSTHSRPKAAGERAEKERIQYVVSTHSRPKAAGSFPMKGCRWLLFQHTAARRRLGDNVWLWGLGYVVSTHSRPKAAGSSRNTLVVGGQVSTHSRPKAAGRHGFAVRICRDVSTHSRPKAAGSVCFHSSAFTLGFNTQPPEGGWIFVLIIIKKFQSFNTQPPEGGWLIGLLGLAGIPVSTHSRPKAAG